MRRFLALSFALFSADALVAQTPYLVRDINTMALPVLRSSSPSNFVADGDVVYFSASSNGDEELWKLANGQVSRVIDLVKPFSASPNAVHPMGNGVALFSAAGSPFSLFRTDGTAAGTSILKSFGAESQPHVVVDGVFHGLAYFHVTTGALGREVWVSDGSESGTRLLKDLNGTIEGSDAVVVGALGERVILTGAGGLWSTDGTEAGTVLVKGGVSPRSAVIQGSKIYFAGTDVTNGYELWTSDGTAAGTRMVTVLNATTASSFSAPVVIAPAGAGVVFFGNDGTNAGLWASNGTASGTIFLAAVEASLCSPNCKYGSVAVANNLAYFNTATQLWRTDGTVSGTYPIDAAAAIPPFEAFSSAYYVMVNGTATISMRRTDGTIGGTTTAFTLPPGWDLGAPAFTGGRLFFRYRSNANGSEPWVSVDGNTASLLANIEPDGAPSASPNDFRAAAGLLFFTAMDDSGGRELWRSDGSHDGTVKLTSTGSSISSYNLLTGFRDSLYFRPWNSLPSPLWKSTGAPTGTGPAEIFPSGGVEPDVLSLLAAAHGLYVGTRTDGTWVTDGTAAGTRPLASNDALADLYLESANHFVELDDRLFFCTYGPQGNMLWRSDGTPATTLPVGSCRNWLQFSPAGGALYFQEGWLGQGTQLWRIDGSGRTTTLVREFTSMGSAPLVAAGRYAYFTARTGVSTDGLWRTDGTPQGTVMILGAADASVSYGGFAAVGETLYFVGGDTAHGLELWRTDGTAEGTMLVSDIAPGSVSSWPRSLTAVDDEVWFSANDGTSGWELWRSDGTATGTALVADILPGTSSSSPDNLLKIGRRLFFGADDGVTGVELRAVDLHGSAFSIGSARITEGDGSNVLLRFVVTREGDTSSTASVSFSTEAATAMAGTDYVPAEGVLSFVPGQPSGAIEIAIVGDQVTEDTEVFSVVLSSPTGGVLSHPRAFGSIDDEDDRVDLKIEAEMTGREDSRRFLITNAGPSTATGVLVRATESPALVPFRTIAVDPIPPGQTRAAGYSRERLIAGDSRFLPDLRQPGYTVTASVSSNEPEINDADNIVSNMTNASSSILLPPFLEVSRSANVGAFSWSGASFASDSLLTITPSFIPSGSPPPLVSISAGPTPGRSAVNGIIAGLYFQLTYPIVAVGERAKLDTVLSVIGATGVWGTPLTFKITILGARPDGVLPTGTVVLKDDGNNVVGQVTLDANASALFTRSALSAGSSRHTIEYAGDASFNPMRASFDLRFDRAPTTTTGSLIRTSCRIAEGKITVRATSGATPPAGRLIVDGSGFQATYVLTPTGQAGESSAMVRIKLSSSNTVYFWYAPDTSSNHAQSSMVQTISASDCSGLGTGLFVIRPCRVIDTRGPAGPTGGPSIASGTIRTVTVAGRCGIPTTARSVAANVTVVSPGTNGFLRLTPSGVLPVPDTSSISYRTGRTRAGNGIVLLNSDGAVDVYNGGSASVYFVIDIFAYFQ